VQKRKRNENKPPFSGEVKNAWSHTSTPLYVFMAWYFVKHRNNLTFILRKKGTDKYMRRIFGTMRKELAEDWRRLHNEELHNWYTGNQLKEDEMGVERSTLGRVEKCIQILIEKLEGKRPLRRPRRVWEDNI
jgi:hypothetical protein